MQRWFRRCVAAVSFAVRRKVWEQAAWLRMGNWALSGAELTRSLRASLRGAYAEICDHSVFSVSLFEAMKQERFPLKPQLAEAWNHVSLENIQADEHLRLTKTTYSKHIVLVIRNFHIGSLSHIGISSPHNPLMRGYGQNRMLPKLLQLHIQILYVLCVYINI